MGNITLFSALSCPTRVEIVKLLLREEMHISAIARKLQRSVPVISRHIQLLEHANLVSKKVIGNVHLIHVDKKILNRLFDAFLQEATVEIEENDTLLDALIQLPFIIVVKHDADHFISSVDEEEGYYVYEVDGQHPDVSIDKFKPSKDVTVFLSKLVAIHQKKILVRVKKSKHK